MRIPRHGVVCPFGVINSWIFCVLNYSCNLRILIFFFWYVHLWNFLFLFWCCHSWNFLLVVHSWDFLFFVSVAIFLHSFKTSAIIFIVLFGCVDILDKISQSIETIKTRILVVGVGKRVHVAIMRVGMVRGLYLRCLMRRPVRRLRNQ